MQQYHSNARTNVHNREQIAKSHLPKLELANLYKVSVEIINKWQNRTKFTDKSSTPKTIRYKMTEEQSAFCLSIRKSSWLPLDEVLDMTQAVYPLVSRSALYRLFKREGVNKVPEKEREKAHKFKEYEPGFIHIDVTYCPKIQGKKHYLFVAIDRATRIVYARLYANKTAENAESFLLRCLEFFPYVMDYTLTDNGLEFTNRRLKSKKDEACQKISRFEKVCVENDIEHRLTKPATPKTNGMVERANGTIKQNTFKRSQYENLSQMEQDINRFIVFYNLYRRHGGVRKELKVRTPFDAVEKWYYIKPEIFRQKPCEFKKKILSLRKQSYSVKKGTTL